MVMLDPSGVGSWPAPTRTSRPGSWSVDRGGEELGPWVRRGAWGVGSSELGGLVLARLSLALPPVALGP